MGAGGQKHSMHEIDETRASVRDDQFEQILERIKSVAEEYEEETHPLYADLGEDEFEIGSERLIHFNLNKFDFELSRKHQTHRISGEGRQKYLEENSTPKISMTLRRKSQYDNNWQVVDLEDLF